MNIALQRQPSASRDNSLKVTVGPRKCFNRVDSLPISARSVKYTRETIITPQQSAVNSERQSDNRTTLLSSSKSNNRVTPFYFKVCKSSDSLLIKLKRLIVS